MFDDMQKVEDDNPTVGLILCTDKDKAIVKYSVLKENKQLFASKYMLYLPSEEELTKELEREKWLIEMAMENGRQSLTWTLQKCDSIITKKMNKRMKIEKGNVETLDSTNL